MIVLKDVWKIYELGKIKVIALRNIHLKINRGDYISIMGPSGSGKSTLLNIIGCLDKPTKGDVFYDNINVSRLNEKELTRIRRERIGFVFQQFYLIPRLTALENVMLPMWFKGVEFKERRKRALELLEMVGLRDKIHHRPNELSGGEQQRVAIARALANDPDIILADEPTGNLDTKTGMEIIKIFEELNKMGKTILIVTHNPEIGKRARRRIYLKDGKIVSYSTFTT